MLRTLSEKRVRGSTGSCVLLPHFHNAADDSAWFAGEGEDEDTLRQANLVLQGFLNTRNLADFLAKSNCVLILPTVRSSVSVSGARCRGPLLCRSGQNFDGKWSTPAMYSVGGMSAGFQVKAARPLFRPAAHDSESL